MNRDTVKTLAGLVVIALIVVATFMYGNAQRQSQLKHDQSVKAQQDAKAADQARKAQPQATGQVAQAQGAAPSAKPSSNTAPVQSPASNAIQGSKPSASPTPATSPKPSPSPSGQVAGAATTPVAGGTGAVTNPLPQTGSPLAGVIGATAVLGAAALLARSKRAVYRAVREQR